MVSELAWSVYEILRGIASDDDVVGGFGSLAFVMVGSCVQRVAKMQLGSRCLPLL